MKHTDTILITGGAGFLGSFVIERLRAQLESDLQTTTKRLEATEKARDAAIATLEAAATRGRTPPPSTKHTADS